MNRKIRFFQKSLASPLSFLTREEKSTKSTTWCQSRCCSRRRRPREWWCSLLLSRREEECFWWWTGANRRSCGQGVRRCSGLELKLVAVRPGSGAPACSLVQAARNRKPRQGCRRQRANARIVYGWGSSWWRSTDLEASRTVGVEAGWRCQAEV